MKCGCFPRSESKYQAQCSRPNTRWLSHRAKKALEIEELWTSLVGPNVSVGHVTRESYESYVKKIVLNDNNDFPRAPALLHYRDLLMKYASQIKETPQLLTFGPNLEYEVKGYGPKHKVVDFGAYKEQGADLHLLSISDLKKKLIDGTSGVDFCHLAMVNRGGGHGFGMRAKAGYRVVTHLAVLGNTCIAWLG